MNPGLKPRRPFGLGTYVLMVVGVGVVAPAGGVALAAGIGAARRRRR